MATQINARAAILARVRSALGRDRPPTPELIAAEWSALPQTYRREAQRSREQILDLLEDRLRDYDAHVERVLRHEMGVAIRQRLQQRGDPRMIVPAGLPPELLAGGNFTEDTGLGNQALDQFNGVLTEASLAIALTGTLVLQNVPGQGRRAVTLIPDYHLCVVDAADVVETVPEAMDRLRETSQLPTTFVSGPSATADIEMTRIKGVHGPRVLDVLLVMPSG